MDTGPWVALVDRSESRHGECVEWLKRFEGEIFSSEAVLTEVYLLNFSSAAQFAAPDFILTGAVVLVPSSIESLKMVKSLMQNMKTFPWTLQMLLFLSLPMTWELITSLSLIEKITVSTA